MLRSKNLIYEKVSESSLVSDFLLPMNINVLNEDNLCLIKPLFCIQVPNPGTIDLFLKSKYVQEREVRVSCFLSTSGRMFCIPGRVYRFYYSG